MKRVIAGVFAVSVLIFSFQNCGKAGFENETFGDELNLASEIDPKFSSLPFPYEVSVNQLAHMSCPINVSSPTAASPYFSWKVGAFDNPADVPTARMSIRPAGLQLTPKFLEEWAKVSTVFNPTFRETKLKEALSTLPGVANTQLQLSFRKTSAVRTELMKMPDAKDSPVFTFMPTISTEPIFEKFLDLKAQPVNFFPNAAEYNDRFLEKGVIVPSAFGNYDTALKANYDASYLTLGFAKGGDGSNGLELTGPDAGAATAYGKGYRVHFGVVNPHTGTSAYPASDSLAVVEEYDLETGTRTPGVGWDCSYKFKIVRPEDRFNTMYKKSHFALVGNACPTAPVQGDYCVSPIDNRFGIPTSAFGGICPSNRPTVRNQVYCQEQYYATCPMEPYTGTVNHPNPIQREDGVYHPRYPERPAILHALRRFLPPDQWDINVSRGCIVPKNDDNACYRFPEVVYDETFFPGAAANPALGQYEGCGVNGQYQCAAYLTLCVRR